MYRIEFLEYNDLMQQVMSEKDTLQNIIDIWLDGKPSKEEKKHLSSPENWAKYAFDNNLVYPIVVYKNNNNLYASISFGLHSISIDFLDNIDGVIQTIFSLSYERFDLLSYTEKNKIVYNQNKDLFLFQLDYHEYSKHGKSFKRMNFSKNNKVRISMSLINKETQDWKNVEQTVEANTSNNFIRCPKDYKDFIYLLDYKNNIKPEYFDIIEPEEETPPKPAPYKIHEGKEYTKEEWQQYQEEKRKNARPGTTWSLLDD